MPATDLRSQIVEFFDDDAAVVGVYLYGSFAQGRTTPHSDVDVGVLYPFGQAPDAWARLQMAEDLATRLGLKVDLVDLSSASPVLGMQVLRKGELLLCRDRRALNDFFVRTVTAYADLKIVRRPIEQHLGKVGIYDRS